MSISSKLASVVGAGVLAIFGVLGASPAWAHDVVSPTQVQAGSVVSVTVAVVNEHDLPTDAVELRMPPGFALKTHQEVPGWKSQVVKSNGTATAIRWTGGLLQPNETGEFVLGGTAPVATGSIVWVVAQKSLGRGDYVAPPISFSPQMTVSAQSQGSGTSSAAPVPLAGQRAATSARTVDGVARSRATLALVLAGLALVAVVFFEMTLVRRGQLAAGARDGGSSEQDPSDGSTDRSETPVAAGATGAAGRPPRAPSGKAAAPAAPAPTAPARKGTKRKSQQPTQPVAK